LNSTIPALLLFTDIKVKRFLPGFGSPKNYSGLQALFTPLINMEKLIAIMQQWNQTLYLQAAGIKKSTN
jgi:hypothetical protein